MHARKTGVNDAFYYFMLYSGIALVSDPSDKRRMASNVHRYPKNPCALSHSLPSSAGSTSVAKVGISTSNQSHSYRIEQ